MSKSLVLVVACIYGYVAIEQLLKGNKPGFIVWSSYAAANIGLYWGTK
jgi:hypothetical protein